MMKWSELKARACELRTRFDLAFGPDTAYGGLQTGTASAGHCAAVALIVREAMGGDLVSANVRGESHWFNRIATVERIVDLDLTGDQFGLPAVQTASACELYAGSERRNDAEITAETLVRASRLATRAGLLDHAASLGRAAAILMGART